MHFNHYPFIQGPLFPFCQIIHPIFWGPFSFWLFLLHLHSPVFSSSLSSSPSSFYTLFSPPKSALHLNPHSSSLLLSFLQTTPQSYSTSQFNHCTSESYEFLCFIRKPTSRLHFVGCPYSTAVQKTGCYISSLLLFALQGVGSVLGMLGKF